MREVKLANGKTIEVRPMTRAELRNGKDLGFGSIGFSTTVEKFDQAMDYALEAQIPVQDLDQMGNPDLMNIFEAVRKETYGDKDEEKNLPKSGPTAQTESGSSAVPSAENGTNS